MNDSLPPQEISIPIASAKGVLFIIIDEKDMLLFCSPKCVEVYGMNENENIEWIAGGDDKYIRVKRKTPVIDPILVTSVFELAWHGKKARMLLLEEKPNRQRLLTGITSEKGKKTQTETSPWISFRCRFDPNLEMLSLSGQVFVSTGYKAEALLSNSPCTFRELISNQERAVIWRIIQKATKEGKPYQTIYSFRSAAGDTRWMQEQGQAVVDEKGNLTALEGWIIDITDRKKMEDALWESESRYRSLVEASPDSVLMLDKDGNILLANRHFCDLLGISDPEEILEKSVFDVINSDSEETTTEEINQLLSMLPTSGKDLTLKLKDGTNIPIETNISIIKGSAGEPNAYIVVGRDLRQRNQTQQALRESEARYRAIVEDNPEMVIRFQKNGTVSFANAAFCKYVNLALDDLIGQKISSKVNGPGHHLIEKLISQLSPDIDRLENEFSIRSSKGIERWFRWKTIAVKDDEGRFLEYQSIGEDITDQKKARLAEQESQNRLHEILENIKLIAIILDYNGKVIFVNSHFLEITGWTKEEVIDQEWVSRFVPVDQAEKLKTILFEGAFNGNVPVRNENPIITRTGEERLIAWYNTILRDLHGEFVGIASIGEDITEKHFSDNVRETILKISQASNQTDNLSTLFTSIQDALKDLMPVENFFIALYDHEKDLLSFPFYADEFDPQPAPGKPRHGLTEYVLRTGNTMLVNPEKFEKLVASGEVESIGAPSIDWIGVPLKLENKTIGVMGAQTYSPGIRYSEQDVQILTFVSNQIAMAIERKRAEQALRSSQRKNELLIEASTDAIFTETLDGTILDFNNRASQMYGYSREELLNLKVTSLVEQDFASKHPDYLQWELQQGGMITDIPNKRKDGTIFPVEISIRQTMADDRPILIAYVRDITERKQAAKVIMESEEKFRTLAENAAAGIFIHSGGKNIYVNPMWSLITEYSASELLMMKPIDLIDSSINHVDKEKLGLRMLGENVPDRFEFNILSKAGEKKVIDLNITAIKFEEKDAFMGTAIDITNRKQREHELEVITQMSEALRRSISRDEVITTTIAKISEILDLDGAFLAIVDKEKSFILIKKGTGVWKSLEDTSLPLDRGISGHIVSTGQLYINHQPRNDPYIYKPDLVKNLESIAGVPLITNGVTIGSLVIGSKQRFTENDIRLLKAIGEFAASSMHRADLFEQSILQASELKQAYNSTLEGWALALELRDKETQGHSVRIANLTLTLARQMGIPESEMEKIRRGALLHDIGKLGVPDTILLKHGTLNADEWAIMQKHPLYAHEMLSQLKDFKDSIDIPYCHHEWWDGSGYPRGLEGNDIPLSARIFCIVDVWDALTSNRPYRDAWKKNEALAHIINQAGTHFDPDVVNKFIAMIVDEK